ncbi:MAG TPA: TadE family protein [Bryobacteraceae bacterium]|nr:TadE family protein [Bryobacteraceae bacterium]
MHRPNKATRKNQRGTSILEFALFVWPTLLMLMGVVVIGNELGRAVQAGQVCRDADSMYVRGVDFSLSGNQAELARIGSGLNLQTSNSGNGLVILSKVTFIPDPSSSCGQPTSPNYSTCTTGQYRLAQRTIFGNTSLPGTHFTTTGTPTYDSENNVTNYSDYTNGTAATINNFQNNMVLYPGQFIYISETYFQMLDLSMLGFQSSPGVYSVAFF